MLPSQKFDSLLCQYPSLLCHQNVIADTCVPPCNFFIFPTCENLHGIPRLFFIRKNMDSHAKYVNMRIFWAHHITKTANINKKYYSGAK